MTSEILAHGIPWALGAAFVGGFLTSLTPCVYPMITITVGIFGARGPEVTRLRAMVLATTYVLGIAATYTSLGMISALVGRAFGTYLASPWVVIPTALLLILFALSLFGVFEFALPGSLQHRLSNVGGRGLGGAFSMGLVGGLLAAPCTGPILASILAYVSTTRSIALGGLLLFSYSLGMGVLFFLIAAFAFNLPKSGGWMDSVKSIFGVVLLVAAGYFLRPIFPALANYGQRTLVFLAGHLAVICTGVALGGIHASFHHTPLAHKLRKAVGLSLIVAGAIGLLGAALAAPVAVQKLVWNHDESAGIIAARQTQRPVFIDIYADWCLPCKELELKTFASPQVTKALGNFYLIKVNATRDEDPVVQEILAKYQAETLPTLLIFDSQGKLLHHIDHFVDADELLPLLRPLY